MFGLILISVISALHLYVFWRAASIPLVTRHIPVWGVIVSGFLLWSLFVAGRVFGHGRTGNAAYWLELVGMNWMAVLFLVSVCLLFADALTGFGFFMPGVAPRVRAWALSAGLVLSALAMVQGLRPPEITGLEVVLPGLPPERDGIVAIALSDLHLGSLLDETWADARVSEALTERPDLVFLLGDLFEGHGESVQGFLPALSRLGDAPLGVWVVPGNHEYFGRSPSTLTLVERAGFRLLRNQSAEALPGLVIAGVEDLTYLSRRGQNLDPVTRALAGRPAGATILLSHTPWEAEKAASAGVGLMLSGHTHGGQIWPFGYLVRRAYPLFAGRYDVGGMTVVVGRGTGTWGPRMRLWKRGEILRITLRSPRKEGPSKEDVPF